MSKFEQETLKRMVRAEQTLERVRKGEIEGTVLTFAPAALAPFPLASSGNNVGFFPQSRVVVLLVFNVSVYVQTTNSGAAYWTLALLDATGTTLASVNTSAIGPDAWTRRTTSTFTQPGSTNAAITLRATATGSPGSIYIAPELIVD